MKNFWRKWRREIIRGGVLFGIVVACGLWIASSVHHGRDRLMHAFNDRLGSLNVNFDEPGRQRAVALEWHGAVGRGQTVWIRNLSGAITVEPAAGRDVELVAEKSWRGPTPDSVRVVTVGDSAGGGLTICALWGDESSCGARGRYDLRNPRNTDVAIRLIVRVPSGLAVNASMINGSVAVTGVHGLGDLTLETVNGGIHVAGISGGPVRAKTVNGSVDLALDAFGARSAVRARPAGGGVTVALDTIAPRDVSIETVNGAITLVLPPQTNADLDASAVLGRVATEFPLQMTGTLDPKHVRGRIGSGGPTLRLKTVRGQITISQAPPAGGVTAPAPAAPRAPGAPATRTGPPRPPR